MRSSKHGLWAPNPFYLDVSAMRLTSVPHGRSCMRAVTSAWLTTQTTTHIATTTQHPRPPQPQSAHQDRRERDHCENPRSPEATRREPVYGSGTLPSRRGDTQRPASMLPTLWGPSSTKPSTGASRRKLRKPSRTSCALLQTKAPLCWVKGAFQPWNTSKLFLHPHGYSPSPSLRHSPQAPPPPTTRPPSPPSWPQRPSTSCTLTTSLFGPLRKTSIWTGTPPQTKSLGQGSCGDARAAPGTPFWTSHSSSRQRVLNQRRTHSGCNRTLQVHRHTESAQARPAAQSGIHQFAAGVHKRRNGHQGEEKEHHHASCPSSSSRQRGSFLAKRFGSEWSIMTTTFSSASTFTTGLPCTIRDFPRNFTRTVFPNPGRELGHPVPQTVLPNPNWVVSFPDALPPTPVQRGEVQSPPFPKLETSFVFGPAPFQNGKWDMEK